jgi:hypothetical protein
MVTPNQTLLELYGNDELLKEANLPLAATLAAAVLTLGLVHADRKHREAVEEESEHLLELARMAEASKMKQTTDALSKTAAAVGKLIVQAGQNKEAFAGALFTKALSTLGKAAVSPTGRKAITGAGVLGAGYLGYKGLQKAKDYAESPGHTNASWGKANSPLMHNVNEYGYPMY